MSMLEFEEYNGKLNTLKPALDDLQDALDRLADGALAGR